MFELYTSGLLIALEPQNLLFCFVGVFLGTIIGMMPGVGSVAGISMLLPLTYSLPPTSALIMLCGIYYGTEYGGSTTSILLRTPGEGGSVVSCLDGYAMAKRGQPKRALATAAIGSFIAGTLSTVAMMMLAVPLAGLAIRMAPPEYFAVGVFALVLTATLASEAPAKGLAMLLLGLLLATIGLDSQSAVPRFTLGSTALIEGIPFIIAATGLFAVSEVMFMINRGRGGRQRIRLGSGKWISLPDLRRIVPASVRGTVIGFFAGLMPGLGGSTSTFLSYNVERSISLHPEEFGTGAIEGLAGPESANNANSQASMVPLFALGIPGSAATAVLLGAFLMYGLQPGPLLMQGNPQLVFAIVASMYVGNIMLLILNLPLIPLFAKLLDIPPAIMTAGIVVFVFTSVFLIRGEPFDLVMLGLFGALGYVLRRFDFPLAPILMGLVLGDLLESSLRRSLALTLGDPMIFLTRPISGTIVALTIVVLCWRLWVTVRKLRAPATEVR